MQTLEKTNELYEAEHCVVGSILLMPQLFDELRREIQSSDFASDEVRIVFEAADKIHLAGKSLDVITLANELKKQKKLDVIGGAAFLAKLFQSVPHAHHAKHYASIVRENSERRKLQETIRKASDDALDPSSEVPAVIASLQSSLAEIEHRSSNDPLTMAELMPPLLTELEERFSGKKVGGTPTGFKALDEILGGLRGGELIILAARTGMGKSSLAMNIAHNITKQSGTVLFFSLEMSRMEFSERMLSSASMVSQHKIQNGSFSLNEMRELNSTAAELMKLPLLIDDQASVSVRDVIAAARIRQRKGGLALIVVDYLQLLTPATHKVNREQQVSEMSRSLKIAAKDLNVPILCLAQLNRQSEQTADKRPALHHLRESGAIEQDANVVLFIHQDHYYTNREEDKGKAEIIVAKQRNGPRATAAVTWMGEIFTFGNAADPIRYGAFDSYNSINLYPTTNEDEFT